MSEESHDGGDQANLNSQNFARDESSLVEQLKVAKDNIQFLKEEHAYMLKGLHDEIERLHHKCRG